MKFLLKLIPMFMMILLMTACNDGSLQNSSTGPSVNISIAANGINAKTLTLTNNGTVNISRITAPQISSALSSNLIENTSSSTCASATFPLAPGSSCTYVFNASGSSTVPGAESGTVGFSLAFADGTNKDESLPATVSNYLYAGNSEGVYRWNGSAWSSTNSRGNGPTSVVSLLAAPDSSGAIALYAGSNTGSSGEDVQIWNGSNWTPVTGGTAPINVYALAYTKNNGTNTLFTGSNQNASGLHDIYSYSDNTWTDFGNDILVQVQALISTSATDGDLYVGRNVGGMRSVSRYHNGAWNAVVQGASAPNYITALAFDSANNILYTGSVGNTSTTGSDVNYHVVDGSGWQAVGSDAPKNINALALDASGNLYAGDNNDTYVWVAQSNAGTYDWNGIASSSDGSHLAATVEGSNVVYISSDSGTNWTPHTITDATALEFIISSATGQYLYVADPDNTGVIHVSSDYGTTWVSNTAGSGDITGIASSADGSHVVVITFEGAIFLSSDYGVTWTQASNAPSYAWGSVSASSDGSHVFAAAVAGTFWISSDSGSNWTQLPNAPNNIIDGRVACSGDGTHLYIADPLTGNIWVSTDSGLSWTQLTSTLMYDWDGIISSDNGEHVAVWSDGDGVLYTSSDYGQTWVQQLGTAQFIGASFSTDGLSLAIVERASNLYTGTLSDIAVYESGVWSALTGIGVTPSHVNALILDSASNLYSGSTSSSSGSDVNEYSNSSWTALDSSGAPTDITSLALGAEVQISTASS